MKRSLRLDKLFSFSSILRCLAPAIISDEYVEMHKITVGTQEEKLDCILSEEISLLVVISVKFTLLISVDASKIISYDLEERACINEDAAEKYITDNCIAELSLCNFS